MWILHILLRIIIISIRISIHYLLAGNIGIVVLKSGGIFAVQ